MGERWTSSTTAWVYVVKRISHARIDQPRAGKTAAELEVSTP